MKLPTTDTVVANLLHRIAKAAIDGDYATLADTQQRLAALAELLFPEGTKLLAQLKRSPLNTKPSQRQQIALELAALAETERAYVGSIGKDGRSAPEAWERYYATQSRISELAIEMYRDAEALKRAASIKRKKGRA